MTLTIPPGFAQVAYEWTLSGDPEPMIVTLGADVSEFNGNFVNAAATYRDRFTSAFTSAGMSNEWTFRGVVMRVGQDVGPPVIVESRSSLNGSNAATHLPNNCTALVRKQTNRGGRTGRGRMFLPAWCLPEAQVDGRGMLHEDLLTALQANVDQWLEGLQTVLLHNDAAPGGVQPSPITNFIVDSQIATQRRRMRS